MRRAISATATVLLVLASILPEAASASTLFASPDDGSRTLPSWEAPETSFKMGLVSTAILSATEPEVALAHAAIVTPRLHGSIGEAFVNSQLHATGGWKPIPPRHGPQGIDHVWMKFDKAGRPSGLIVGETKFGTSRLGMTKSGRQMSSPWISKRLFGLADDWDAMAKDVALRHGDVKARPFRLRADYLRAAAEGRVSYRSEIFRVKVKGDMANISVQRLGADGFPLEAARSLPPIKIAGQPANVVKAQLIGEVHKIYPAIGKEESRDLANRLYAQAKSPQAAISAKSPALRLVGTTGAVLAAGGLVAGGTDVFIQLISGNPFDWSRVGTMTGLGGFSAVSAEAAQLAVSQALMRSVVFRTQSVALGRSMGLLPSQTISLLPKVAGGIVGAVAFAYGGYAIGLYDLKDANRAAIAGAAGVAVGGLTSSAATAGLMAYAATFGTASTGTAISSLSGAAATNASLAWLGGGAISAEGGGVAGGVFVLSATGAIVFVVAAVGITSAVMYGFRLYDAKQDWQRVGKTIDVLRNHEGDYPGNPFVRAPAAVL